MNGDGPVAATRLGDHGEAEIRICLDRETYRKVQQAYLRAVDAGYSEDFDTYAHNHCATTPRVVVTDEEDGEEYR